MEFVLCISGAGQAVLRTSPPGPVHSPTSLWCPALPERGPHKQASVVQPSSGGGGWTGQPPGARLAAVPSDHPGTPWSDLMEEAEPLLCQPWVLSCPAGASCENGGHLVAARLLTTASLPQRWPPCRACGSLVSGSRGCHTPRGCNVVCGALVLSSSHSCCWTGGFLGDAETVPSLPSSQNPLRQPCSGGVGVQMLSSVASS